MHRIIALTTVGGCLLAGVPAAAQTELPPAWLQGPQPPLSAVRPDTDRLIAQALEEAGGHGAHLTFNGGIYGDIIGMFFGLLASGSYDRAYRMRDGVCAAWRALPPNGPFTGRATVRGVEVNLDRLCGVHR